MPLTFDKTIKAGDLLTTATVIIAAVTLMATIDRERWTREHEMATKVRQAAATAISKLDRWQALQLARYEEVFGFAVELSEQFASKPDPVLTRDALWKAVMASRTKVQKQIIDEQLGSTYSELVANFPAARGKYSKAFDELARVEEASTATLLAKAESAVLAMPIDSRRLRTAELGNHLRTAAGVAADELRTKSNTVLEPLRKYLLDVIALPDSELIGASRKRDG